MTLRTSTVDLGQFGVKGGLNRTPSKGTLSPTISAQGWWLQMLISNKIKTINPKPLITYLFKDLCKQIMLGNPKKVGYLGSR